MKRVILCLSLVLVLSGITAQDIEWKEQPSWLILEKGKVAFEQRDFGFSLRVFRHLLEIGEYVPEAETWIGMIFLAEGEYLLAEQQFLKALDLAALLYIRDEQYEIRYLLADVYKLQRKWDSCLQVLNGLVDTAPVDRQSQTLQIGLSQNIRNEDIDHVLMLYRFDEPVLQRAYFEMGSYYYLTGDYQRSIDYFSLAVISPFSRIQAYLEDRDPDYSYTTLVRFLHDAQKREILVDLQAESRLVQGLYYLAGSLWFGGYPEKGRIIWQDLARFPEAGEWRDKALQQLADPLAETLPVF